ncbi:hypothetical protein PF005_g22773 [Phytophthora fragariae]|uniref:Secreted protein n=1 Tax=Phytophthora fragariae TaxID=53985 RepID=A0A6A3EL01_9STRA|nr:hypothetical protein PF003_g29658 [Phytophthora fragariae]KAE8933183.1 hypothetical protein PF009_g16806 [Phytophthora fragariae]KAE8982569.1 hypothetical protein PF011_g21562 [Phytophthora fragariae]KAE9083037.1 hypothetical protein PF007_g22068 [Phytophthora fragariae]KAE9084067.1 hypothetical protein PF010_g20984 [Phytophthora fragariae]
MSASPDQALWGVLCLAFFFLFRRSEMASLSKDKFRLFALEACDVATLNETNRVTRDASRAASGHIRLRGSKTNQAGHVTMRMLRCWLALNWIVYGTDLVYDQDC